MGLKEIKTVDKTLLSQLKTGTIFKIKTDDHTTICIQTDTGKMVSIYSGFTYDKEYFLNESTGYEIIKIYKTGDKFEMADDYE